MNDIDEFKVLLSQSFKECLGHITDAIGKGIKLENYNSYPIINYNKDYYFPYSYNIDNPSSPLNYCVFLNRLASKSLDDFTNTRKFVASIAKNELFFEKLIDIPVLYREESEQLEIVNTMLRTVAFSFVDRYVNIYNTKAFDSKYFDELVTPLCNLLSSNKVHFDLYVPILFAVFDEDEIILNESTSIIRMDEEFHLSRLALAKMHSHDISLHACSSHAYVIKNIEYEYDTLIAFNYAIRNYNIFPLEQINNFFASICLVKSSPTGYSQLIIKPIGWETGSFFHADLIPLTGKTTDHYNLKLDQYKHIKHEFLTKLNLPNIESLKHIYNKLIANQDGKMKLAIERYIASRLRKDSYDTLLDLCIAFEALLSDGSRSEVTHKLAMRVAALTSYFEDKGFSPKNTYNDIKDIYDCRSNIIHGKSRKKIEQKSVKYYGKNKEQGIRINVLAFIYLENIIKVLLEKPEFCDPSIIDDLIMSRLREK